MANIQRSFSVGDKWLYYKIFCGHSSSNKILLDILKPLNEEFISNEIITQWFFIRYNDPSNHIRYRIKLKDENNIGKVILRINEALKEFIKHEFIWNIQIDTYNREIERYGENTMEISESIFFNDSRIILTLLGLLETNNEKYILSLLGIKIIDFYLECFKFSPVEKLQFCESLKSAFYNEFGINKLSKKQFDMLYNDNNDKINNILTDKKIDKLIIPYKKEFTKNTSHILDIKKDNALKVNFNNLLSSYIHMSINRLFSGNNRMHELISYDFLWRYYKKINYQIINNPS
ncbi:thiopeptide-type bacteriocin biosynthesis protein [Elizabethkingia ursingii]|uniref:Thiopeptide-type bacteriocin biosynthesis domain-containing protein n=1 Tax=Elizabethkingia ursingii TaxID=1756150 RepID=A0ABX3N4T3_9FLAO|nr:thiopeptide-type bacteriocin biosynthesis protein [Elizabethkingia ursingii]OPB85872.1 hypothetical protein BB021_12500 [Elizabethkingia ursingii]